MEEVRELVRAQSADQLAAVNDHRITLKDALVAPKRISVIARMVQEGRIQDHLLSVWVVAKEQSNDGYRIVMREDGSAFGLASSGFPNDEHLVLDGWYGDLLSAFLNM